MKIQDLITEGISTELDYDRINDVTGYDLPPLERLLKLPTHRLLAFYKKHRRLRRWPYYEIGTADGPLRGEEKWGEEQLNYYMDQIKSALDSREHVN